MPMDLGRNNDWHEKCLSPVLLYLTCLVIKEGQRLLYGFQEKDIRRQVHHVTLQETVMIWGATIWSQQFLMPTQCDIYLTFSQGKFTTIIIRSCLSNSAYFKHREKSSVMLSNFLFFEYKLCVFMFSIEKPNIHSDTRAITFDTIVHSNPHRSTPTAYWSILIVHHVVSSGLWLQVSIFFFLDYRYNVHLFTSVTLSYSKRFQTKCFDS